MVRIKHRYLLVNILYPGDELGRDTDPKRPPYLTFRTPSPDHLNGGILMSILRASISTHFGDVGAGLAAPSLKVVYFSPATSTAIIRCPRQHFRLVWAACTYVTTMPGERRGTTIPCVVQVVRVSGTIRKSEEELLRRSKRDIVRAKAWEESTGSSHGILSKIMGSNAKAISNAQLAAGPESIISEEDEEMISD